MTGVRSRWARLPESLKKSEPHSPINLEATFHRVPKYLELGKQPRPEFWPLYDINIDRLDKL